MNVKVLKLVSGEEIIGKVKKENGKYHIEDPLKIIMVPSGNGIGMALAPYVPYTTNEKIDINEEHVMLEIEPMEDLKSGYISEVTGIVTPPHSGIIC